MGWVINWDKDIKDNKYRCKECGARLINSIGMMQATYIRDSQAFCIKCGRHVADVQKEGYE